MKALQIEYIKLFRPYAYIIAGLLLLAFILRAVFMLQLSAAIDKEMVMKALDAGQVETIYTLFSIFMIINIGKEYSENTLRRSVIEGYTRTQFFTGKILLVIAAGVFALVLQKLVFFISAASAGLMKEALDCLTMAGVFIPLLKVIFYGLFALFLVFVTRSIAFSIVLSIFWGPGESLVHFYLKYKFPEADYGSYLPMASLAQTLGADGLIAVKFVLISIAYQLAMVVSSYGLLANRDIK